MSKPCAFANLRGIGSARQRDVTQNGKSASILLVDDDVEVLKALTKVLEKEGYDVVPQPDAGSAMRYVNETQRTFDVIITDVSMPGMKGTSFLAAIKAAFPKIPVILITAFGDWGQYMDALRGGAYEYLNKPLDKNELLATVRRALTNGKTFMPAV
jgi:DNA-binding NtrC family response regulator